MKTLPFCMSVLIMLITLAAVSFAKEAAWVSQGGLTYRDLKVGSGAVAGTGRKQTIEGENHARRT